MSIKKHHITGCIGKDCDCPYRLDYRPLGLAGKRKRVEFSTKKAAQEYEAATRIKVKNRTYIEAAKIPTFGVVAADWLAERIQLHPATVSFWRTHLQHLAPLNNLRLDRIDVARIEHLRDELVAAGELNERSVGRVLTTAKSIFELAMRRGWATVNPAALAAPPRRRVTELATDDETEKHETALHKVRPDEILSPDEIGLMLDHAKAGLAETILATAAATGMRSEEFLALRWSDLDLNAGRLSVRRSLSWARGAHEKGHIAPKFFPPKTKAGYRTLPIAALVPTLLRWKLRCLRREAQDLVFCEADGRPLRRNMVLQSILCPALKGAGLRTINLKGLRHSYASGLIASGTPVTEIAKLMGHKSATVTLDVYSHWYRNTDTGAADAYAGSFLADRQKSGQKVDTKRA